MPAPARWLDAAVSALLLQLSRPSVRPLPQLNEFSFYTQARFLDAPAGLYSFPGGAPPLLCSAKEFFGWGARRSFSFPSPFEPLNPDFARRYEGYLENHVARGYYYQPYRHRRGTVLYLHGWMTASFRITEQIFFPRLAREAGLAVLALALPYHMSRRPATSSTSGEYMVSADLTRTLEAFRQAVAEVHGLLAWLRQETSGPVGLVGLSLGALVAALALGSGASPDFSVLVQTPAELVRTMQESLLLRWLREDIAAGGLVPEDLERWATLLSPAALPAAPPPERVIFVHGRDDNIALPEGVETLREAWEWPEIVWYTGGHFSIVLHLSTILARCRSFLAEIPAGERLSA